MGTFANLRHGGQQSIMKRDQKKIDTQKMKQRKTNTPGAVKDATSEKARLPPFAAVMALLPSLNPEESTPLGFLCLLTCMGKGRLRLLLAAGADANILHMFAWSVNDIDLLTRAITAATPTLQHLHAKFNNEFYYIGRTSEYYFGDFRVSQPPPAASTAPPQGLPSVAPTPQGLPSVAPTPQGPPSVAPTPQGPPSVAPTPQGPPSVAPTPQGLPSMAPTPQGLPSMAPTPQESSNPVQMQVAALQQQINQLMAPLVEVVDNNNREISSLKATINQCHAG